MAKAIASNEVHSMQKTLVLIPTYNEKGTIKELINAVLRYNVDILVVDDNSPDGTWKIVKELSKKNKKVHLLLRKGKRGRGYAGIAGFKYAIKKNYKYIIEMDSDFSHDPTYILLFLKEIKNYDVVLGSRMVAGGKDRERTFARITISKLANLYIRTILGIKIRDCTSGYRCFKKEVLKNINLDEIKARGPAIVQEILYKIHLKGVRIKEIPIEFKERKQGHSKLTFSNLLESYLSIIRLRLLHATGRYK